ncbi:MAG: hypothetical protein A2600_10395 [Candidatus Lambdaproteobacteria bacterium RIFOXYD1_FULL_56_27]|uniref:RND efflux pump membrane fusion protein barrel-sandwich domain-containing protein n=1 Tax=Candidatus Lambdaproteobacteria bacterium RIFOXYD2_FULL_56_26 TaxID=1817773 RepID=A0A1F6GQJ4_9PROT|nr:MAG: hypothetical protein A2557_09290 [Candidatus Lambdaproteobacteria bacterium RIFOXYD2_FULL_56_26]OGH04126.1 MAG: hypothetical protein A2426_02680 [Candidatus Lambdaproteobacteria bacterium RIFOXYC1_FULL_56_13]OGH06357.1 MAG: hypothetical protein A2600_10395 [Candidatus Lambdaproteobacteria bacterium RIFOXYD1_FULL_56_27]
MSRLTSLLALFLLFSSPLWAQEYQKEGVSLTQVTLVPAAPVVGNNRLTFRLQVPKGQSLGQARVEVEVFMPESGAMPYMAMTAEAKPQGGGVYVAQLQLSMEGTWEMPIQIKRGGKPTLEFPFALTVGRAGLLYQGEAGPASLSSSPKERTYQRQGLTLGEFKLDPTTAEVGDNQVSFTLVNAQGQPLEAAKVEVEAFMPAMGAMPKMSSKTAALDQGKGRYQATLELAMAGSWELPVRVSLADGTKVEFPFSVTVGVEGFVYKGPAEGTRQEQGGGQAKNLYIDQQRAQLIGIELGKVERRQLSKRLLTVARIEVDESRVFDFSLKYSGKIEQLFANREGEFVRKGQALFSIYSPELFEAQEIFLQLDGSPRRNPSEAQLYRNAKEKLLLWDFSPADLEELRRLKRAPGKQVIKSPFSGYIVTKSVVEGGYAQKGVPLFRLADLTQLWALAEVFEFEAYEVKRGDKVRLTLAYQGGSVLEGKVDYLYPFLDPNTRTLKVRILVDNPKILLKPGMYADAEILSDKGERLVLPRRAILFSGRHKYVFLTPGDGFFTPQEIETGQTDGEWVEVIGLTQGQQVTFSANFLISSEAQLRDVLPQFGAILEKP